MWSESWTHCVHFGKPGLSFMAYLFKDRSKLKRQCLLPYFKKDGPNELLVFEKGPNWSKRKAEIDD